MNIDVRVAHEGDHAGAVAAFVYEDLDREATAEQLRAEVYSDFETDYPGYVVDVLELEGLVTKVLARVIDPSTDRIAVSA